jgi:transcriptional regulator with XRE-family HTH domain
MDPRHGTTTTRRATKQEIAGRERAREVARRLGRGLRDARQAAGLTQRAVAAAAGVSQPEIARLEAGRGATARIETWAACAAAVGTQFVGFLERVPGASLPRDIEHLRRQNLVVATGALGGWAAEPEALLASDGARPRSIDVLLTRAARREAAVIEIWDLILDGGEAMRGLEAKGLATRRRLGPDWHVEGLLVVRGTHRNRAVVASLRALFAARYPASAHAWLRALTDASAPLPAGSALAWTDVKGDRLIAARLTVTR